MGKEAVYNLSLLCRHALRRELCWKPKYRNIYISSSYFWFGLRDFPNSRGSQWRTGQPWRACSKAERTCKLLWYPNRLLLFQGCYSNPKKQGVPFSAVLTDAAGSYLGFIRGFLSAKTTADNSIWCNFLKMLSLNWIRFSAGKKSLLLCRSKHGMG